MLSIHWLREFWNTHPEEHALLFYVHGVSLTEKGMKTFAADMKAAGRQDLVERVKPVKAQAVLIETRIVVMRWNTDKATIGLSSLTRR